MVTTGNKRVSWTIIVSRDTPENHKNPPVEPGAIEPADQKKEALPKMGKASFQTPL